MFVYNTLWFLKGKPNVSLNRQIMEHCGCGHGLRHRREDECWWKQKRRGKFGSFLLTYCSFYMFFPVIWLQYSNASRHPLTVRQKTHSKSYLPSPGDAILHRLLWVLSWYIWKYPQYCLMPHIKLCNIIHSQHCQYTTCDLPHVRWRSDSGSPVYPRVDAVLAQPVQMDPIRPETRAVESLTSDGKISQDLWKITRFEGN